MAEVKTKPVARYRIWELNDRRFGFVPQLDIENLEICVGDDAPNSDDAAVIELAEEVRVCCVEIANGGEASEVQRQLVRDMGTSLDFEFVENPSIPISVA